MNNKIDFDHMEEYAKLVEEYSQLIDDRERELNELLGAETGTTEG